MKKQDVSYLIIGSDHGGFEAKQEIIKRYGDRYEIVDMGCDSEESCDYPDFGYQVASEVAHRDESLGIVICGSGVGITISANKVAGIRAANIHTLKEVELACEHNDINVLGLGGRTLNIHTILSIVDAFLTTNTDISPRHVRRRAKQDMQRA